MLDAEQKSAANSARLGDTVLHLLESLAPSDFPDPVASFRGGSLTGYSNAKSEGYNRVAKHEGRNAFGFRNPVNQRRRIRWACTRQHRRASAAKTELPGQVR